MTMTGSERVMKWRKNLKEKIVKAMGGECVCCGYKKCNDALDLHHVNPTTKEFALRDVITHPKKWEIIKKEMKKCILMCKICHTEYHAGIREIPKDYKKFNELLI